MHKEWNFADAKNRFNELVNLALTEGPQYVHCGKDQVIVISAKKYEKLKGKQMKFKDFLLNGPSLTEGDLNRDKSATTKNIFYENSP